jgi:hypothetical protein
MNADTIYTYKNFDEFKKDCYYHNRYSRYCGISNLDTPCNKQLCMFWRLMELFKNTLDQQSTQDQISQAKNLNIYGGSNG